MVPAGDRDGKRAREKKLLPRARRREAMLEISSRGGNVLRARLEDERECLGNETRNADGEREREGGGASADGRAGKFIFRIRGRIPPQTRRDEELIKDTRWRFASRRSRENLAGCSI